MKSLVNKFLKITIDFSILIKHSDFFIFKSNTNKKF